MVDHATLRCVSNRTQRLSIPDGATHIIDGQPRLFAETLGNEQFRAIYRPTNVQVGDNGEVSFPEFRLFVECCFERGDMAMLVDEAHLLCSPAIYRHASRSHHTWTA